MNRFNQQDNANIQKRDPQNFDSKKQSENPRSRQQQPSLDDTRETSRDER